MLRALVLIVLVSLPGLAAGQEHLPARLLLEAEFFAPDDLGWEPRAVGGGNYFVDSIGAAHFSNGRYLHLAANAPTADAEITTVIPESGRYRVWARYEYPWREVNTRFRVAIWQSGREVFAAEYGLPQAVRMWFYNHPDAPWLDLPNGVEGPVAEAHDADLKAGPATVRLVGTANPSPAADRNVDFIFLTTDLQDQFRKEGVRLYPLLDEIGRAAGRRTFIRITNPPEAGGPMVVQAQYTFNRAPWRAPAVQIGADGATRSGRRTPIAPGGTSPWVDLSCPDTTHPCHLHLRPSDPESGLLLGLEVADAPSEDRVLRRIEARDPLADRLLMNLPPYPALEPEAIETAEETVERIVRALEAHHPRGRPPERFLIYGALGDQAERRITRGGALDSLYRRLFLLLGPNAFGSLSLAALPGELHFLRESARATVPFFTYGDYRWFPTDERIEKAQRDLADPALRSELRGFTYGDEVKLEHWYPTGEEAEQGFRIAMSVRGERPQDLLLSGVDAAEGWAAVRPNISAQAAYENARLFVLSHRYLELTAIERLTDAAMRLRESFGDAVLIGANYSPHPFFRPDPSAYVRMFRAGAFNRATHDDYWWQASELGPESTGFLLDAFAAGLIPGRGVIQPYVMPHSPGNTDRGFLLGVWSAIIHGATALDLFQVGPEHGATENYIAARDLDRYQAVRTATHAIGAVEDTLLDGARRPTRAALVLSDSTDRWDAVTQGRIHGVSLGPTFPSIASLTERKGVWQALRHAHVPLDMLLEEDMWNGRIDDFEVVYLVGPNLTREAAEGLAAWVSRGGTLVGTAGAGSLDEYGQPLQALKEVFGVSDWSLEQRDTFFRPRVEVPRLEALDRIWLANGNSFEAVAWRQRLVPTADTVVLGHFDDGAPSVLDHRWRDGRAILIGTLAGTAYLRSGFPQPPPLPDRGPFMHTALEGFDDALRTLLATPAREAARGWPRVSVPLVEAGLVETSGEILVPLANFGPRGIEVAVWIPDAADVGAVHSLEQGPLDFVALDGGVQFRLALELVDFVTLARGSR